MSEKQEYFMLASDARADKIFFFFVGVAIGFATGIFLSIGLNHIL